MLEMLADVPGEPPEVVGWPRLVAPIKGLRGRGAKRVRSRHDPPPGLLDAPRGRPLHGREGSLRRSPHGVPHQPGTPPQDPPTDPPPPLHHPPRAPPQKPP